MFVLAFDTSTPAVTVGVAEDTRILSIRTEVANNKHGELLVPLIRYAMADADVKPGDLAAVGVGLGPGPFTGLRVGIVTARAMTDALGVKAFGCSSLSLIGRGPRGIATNARRKQVYWAVRSDGTFAAGPEIGTPEEAAAQFRTAGVQRVAGEGPVLYPEVFAGWSFDDADRYPNVELLVGYVAGRLSEGADSDDLTPMYLRRPDARPLGKPKAVSPA